MGKVALVVLALASFTFFLLLYGSQNAEAGCSFNAITLVYEKQTSGTACGGASYSNYGYIVGGLNWETSMMGYGPMIGYIQSPSSCTTLPLSYAKDDSKIKTGQECHRFEGTWLLPICDVKQTGIYDSRIDGGKCMNPSTCSNGVPSGIISKSGLSTTGTKVCSRAVCGSQVDSQCDGKAPGSPVSGGECSISCRFSGKPFDFTLALDPRSATVESGASASVPVSFSLEKTQGTAALVPISCTVVSSVSNRPTCSISVTYGGSGSSCTPNNVCGGTMTVRTTTSTPDGTYTVRLSANGGINPPKTKEFTLKVSPSSTFAFIMTANPLNGGEVDPGAASKSTISVIRTTGIEQPVRVSCQPLNFGVACKLNGRSVSTSEYVECTPRPGCPVNLEVSSVIPGPYTVRLNGRGTVTTSATGFVDYKFSVKEPETPPITPPTDRDPPPPSSGTQYGFTLAVDPTSFSILKGTTKQFTATVTKSTTETRTCGVQMSTLAAYDADDLDEYPPKDLTVTLDRSTCNLGPDSPTCSVTGIVRTTGSTPASEYDRYYVVGKCSVGRDRERNERLDIKVVPYITSVSVSPSSGSTTPGGTTNAIATILRTGSQGTENRNIPVSCLDLPGGAGCSFGSTVPLIDDNFNSNSRYSLSDAAGWISNALETNAHISEYGRNGRYDYFMLIVGAPHTEAAVTKSVMVPPLDGRRLFISFDYRLQNSYGPCKLSYRFCSSCRTCRYTENSPAPSQATLIVRGSSQVSETLRPGDFTPVSGGQSCSDSRWGRECRETFDLVGQGGESIGSVRKETDWTYYFSKCRSSGCPEVAYSGGYYTPWRAYSREITDLASDTERRPIEIVFQNMRWGTRYDDAFIRSHYTSVDNVRVYAEPGFGGCAVSRYSSALGGWSCDVPVTIATQPGSPAGTFDVDVLAADGYNWFLTGRYGNIYYDWVTAKLERFTDNSATAPYSLTVNAPCNDDGICALSETQESCPADCNTKVTVDPKELTAGEVIRVNVDFTDGRYAAGSDVGLNLEIESKATGVRTAWDATNGCIYGGGARRSVSEWPEAVSQNGRFATTFYCVIPFTIGGGDKSLIVTPIIY